MNRKTFFAALRRRGSGVFGTSLSQSQVTGIEGILDAFQQVGDGRDKTLAYALATAYHETARAMVPIKETVMPYHKDKNPSDATVIRRLDNWARKKGRRSNIYWRPQANGKAYFGRGFVQLTWVDNYRRSSGDAGADLVRFPEKMLNPKISARVLVAGLLDGRWNGRGKGVAHYLPSDGPDDLRGARRTVNITDKWQEIGGYYKSFLSAIRESGGIPRKVFPIPTPRPPQTLDPKPAPEPPEAPKKPPAANGKATAALLVAGGALVAAFWEKIDMYVGLLFE